MPATITVSPDVADRLAQLGREIHAHRKSLRLSATAVAEAAGISRVTLHRIEKGEPTVTMGAYLSAMAALGLKVGPVGQAGAADARDAEDRAGWIPARIRLADYPQLARLAWQVQGAETLTPGEAWDIYERNWRHVDESGLSGRERQLIEALRLGFSRARHV